MHERDWYLSVNESKDQISVMPNKLLDGMGWDFRKFLRLLYKSNSTTFEWLQSPIVYPENKSFTVPLRELTEKYFQPKRVMQHYLGIATGKLQRDFQGEKVNIKKYFYVLRPVLAAAYIVKYSSPPPVDFYELLPLIKDKPNICDEIIKLLKQKETAMESDEVMRVDILDRFVKNEMERCDNIAKTLPKKQMEWDDINLFYRKILNLV